MRDRGNVSFPTGDRWVRSEVSSWKVCAEAGEGESAEQACSLLTLHTHSVVVTLAGSMVSDPSLGCSSFLKKNIVL